MKTQRMDCPGYEEVWEGRDDSCRFLGYIAIHDTRRGPSLGGVRLWPYPSPEAALADVLRLARSMTYKAAALDLPFGGGKAALIQPSGEFDRSLHLKLFAQMIESLGGRYITAKDVGTQAKDMALIKTQTSWVTGLPKDQGGAGDPSPWTALGVQVGLREGWKELQGDPSLRGAQVAIQGMGHVGSALAKMLSQEGAKILACDVDSKKVQSLAQDIDLQEISPQEILQTPADVFAPCALGQIFNPKTIPKMNFRLIAGAANDQLDVEERDALALANQGILYSPDFIINSGGLIHVAFEKTGYDSEKVRSKVESIGPILSEIFALARAKGINTHEAAMRLAESRL